MEQGENRFVARVYELLNMVPRGRVTTYAALAAAAGNPKAAHAVGAVMRANPHPVVVPCHRVVMSDGKIGGYGGRRDGVSQKAGLLRKEGIVVTNRRIDLSRYLFTEF